MNRAARALRLVRLVAAFTALGALKHVVALPTLARWTWQRPRHHAGDADQITRDILRAGTFGGWPDRDCLQRSLLLYRELSRAGCAPELVVGFERGPSGLEGHAWVRVDGRVVADTPDAVARFEPAMVFGDEGALRPQAG